LSVTVSTHVSFFLRGAAVRVAAAAVTWLLLVCLSVLSASCMALPRGVRVFVSDRGCTSDGVCPLGNGHPCNFYYPPTREIVIEPGQSCHVVAHELCHAHQHQVILDETGREPSDLTLKEWYDTAEAAAYQRAIAGHPRPEDWHMSADTLLEDFAEACGRYLVRDPDYPGDPSRDRFFGERDFR
jgi:hypothetical protein